MVLQEPRCIPHAWKYSWQSKHISHSPGIEYISPMSLVPSLDISTVFILLVVTCSLEQLALRAQCTVFKYFIPLKQSVWQPLLRLVLEIIALWLKYLKKVHVSANVICDHRCLHMVICGGKYISSMNNVIQVYICKCSLIVSCTMLVLIYLSHK